MIENNEKVNEHNPVQDEKPEGIIEHLISEVKEFVNSDFPLSGAEPNESIVFENDNNTSESIVPNIDSNFPLSGGTSNSEDIG